MNPGRRDLLIGGSLFALVGAVVPRRAFAAGWPSVAPPRAPRIDHWIDQLGRRRNDPYAWMRFSPDDGARSEERLPGRIRAHLADEARYAAAMTAPLRKTRDRYLAAMTSRSAGGAAPPPLARGGWRYSTRTPPGAAHPVHVRTGPDGREQRLLDEAQRAAGHAYYRSTGHQPSLDHRHFAWAEDVIGNDRHRICVLDTATGVIRTIVPADAFGYGGLVFGPSSTHLFWIRRDERNRPTRLYRSDLATGVATLVYEEKDPGLFMQVRRTAADGHVLVRLFGPDTAEVRLVTAGQEDRPPRAVIPRRSGVTYDVDEWNDALLLLTDADDAPDRRILALRATDFRPAATLVEHRAGRPILAVAPFRRALVRLERADGLHRVVIRRADAAETVVSFDGPAHAIEMPAGQDYDASSVRLIYQSPADPPQWIDVDLATGARTVVARTHAAGHDPADYVVERIEARADDGAMIPVTVLSRRGAARDGRSPLLLYGYGAYGISSDPVFSLPASVLVDRGWRYAIAHVRGGSERGQRWFLDGRRFAKRNSMTDFVACANALERGGYAASDRIVAYGLSAGGLLVGGAMNIAPQRWAGVIAEVPFVDMLNTMSDADHPLVPLFRPDWGDPLADRVAYDYIASISPYENVRRAPYPPLLATAGLKDDRVPYWEPAKLVAEVRHRSTGRAPAILDVDMDAGHQSSGDQRSHFARMALFWAFADRCAAVGEGASSA